MSTTTTFDGVALPVFGRVMIGSCFVVFGVTKLLAIEGTIAFIGRTGLPFPTLAFYLSILIEAGLGLAILLGIRARTAALLLAAYCVLVAILFHAHFGDRAQRDQFLKNLVMAGGLLQIVSNGFWSGARRGAAANDGAKARHDQ